MKKIAFLYACLLLLAGCGRSLPVVKGEGQVLSKERKLPAYTQIKLECGADIVLTHGQVGDITINGSQNMEPYVITEVKDGVLIVRMSPDFAYQFIKKLEICIPVDESLTEVTVQGSGDITSHQQLQVKELTCNVLGSGDIDLSLQAESLSFSVKGSGDIKIKGTTQTLGVAIAVALSGMGSALGDFDGDALQTKQATASIRGSGDVELFVTEQLSADIRGSGDITVKGNPKKIDVQTKGSGRVRYL